MGWKKRPVLALSVAAIMLVFLGAGLKIHRAWQREADAARFAERRAAELGARADRGFELLPYLILRPIDDDGRPRDLVLYFGGHLEDELALLRDPLKEGVVRALLGAGCRVAAVADPNGWGHAAAVDASAALRDRLSAGGRVRRTVILCQSMGGLAALHAIADPRFKDVAFWYGIYPVCSLNAMRPGRYAREIRAARAARDPMAIPASAFVGKSLRLTASYADTVVPRSEHADRLAARLAGIATVSVVSCEGDHGDRSHFLPADILEFFGFSTH